jgi:Tol biopolymer transport system component
MNYAHRIWLLAAAAALAGCSRGTPVLKSGTFSPVTDGTGQESFPTLSADGGTVVFVSRASGNLDIYSRRIDAGDTVNLTAQSRADDTQPAFSPDGKRIAFRSEREGGGIFVMDAAGGGARKVSDTGFNPSWTPDGTRILYATEGVALPELRFSTSQVWSVGVQDGATTLISTGDAVQPRLSPHGHRIAYWANQSGQRDVWTMPASGTSAGRAVAVTHDAFMDWNPVWSADGAFLYFASDRGGSMNIWGVPINEKTGAVTGPPEAITTPARYVAQLTLSNDGRKIAYADRVSTANLYKLGFDPATETVSGEAAAITQGANQKVMPDVSPDGRWLAFVDMTQHEQLSVMEVTGGGLKRLTNDAFKNRMPRWSPDGKRIAFFSNRSGKYEIWEADPESGVTRQLTSFTGPNANVPLYSPDGRKLLVNVIGGNPMVVDAAKPPKEQIPEILQPIGGRGEFFQAWSWSRDGKKLAGVHFLVGSGVSGSVTYSFEARKYAPLVDRGGPPHWLADSRRLIYAENGRIYVVDSATRKRKEIYSMAPYDLGSRVAAPRDERTLYFAAQSSESSIWIMGAKP